MNKISEPAVTYGPKTLKFESTIDISKDFVTTGNMSTESVTDGDKTAKFEMTRVMKITTKQEEIINSSTIGNSMTYGASAENSLTNEFSNKAKTEYPLTTKGITANDVTNGNVEQSSRNTDNSIDSNTQNPLNPTEKEEIFDQITNTVTKPESDIHCEEKEKCFCIMKCLERYQKKRWDSKKLNEFVLMRILFL
jgi:hypothetical protein